MLQHKEGTIYFLQVPTNQVKIGIVDNNQGLQRRINQFQIANYQKLTLIRTIIGTIATENWLHTHYYRKGKHIRGEWFEFDSEMLTIIPPPYEELKFSILRINDYKSSIKNDEVYKKIKALWS